MSTHIKSFDGTYNEYYDRWNPVRRPAELDLTRFWGGKDNGRMLQLTILSDKIAYIQLTQEQVKELAQTLTNAFNDEIYPSE